MRGRWLTIAAGLAASAPATAQSWHVTPQPGGYQVAGIETAGNLRGLAVTCERGVPMLALRPAAAIGNPATAILKAGGRTATLRLARNGNTDVWFAVLNDRTVLDMLASGSGAVAVAIDSRLGASVPLTGADAAFAAALKPCYTPAAAAAIQAPGTAAGSGRVAPADASAIRVILTNLYRDDAGNIRKTPELEALQEQCFALDPDETGATCGGDVDPYAGGNGGAGPDLMKTLKIRIAPAPVAGMIDAYVTFRSYDEPGSRVFRFVRTPTGWAMDDLFFGDSAGKDGMRETYQTAIAELKAEKR